MAGDGSVGSLGLDGLSVGADEDRGHQSEGAVSLSHGVRLHVSVVVLTGPDEASVALHCLGDHIVDEPVLVPDAGCLELLLVFGLKSGKYIQPHGEKLT